MKDVVIFSMMLAGLVEGQQICLHGQVYGTLDRVPAWGQYDIPLGLETGHDLVRGEMTSGCLFQLEMSHVAFVWPVQSHSSTVCYVPLPGMAVHQGKGCCTELLLADNVGAAF